MEQDTVENKSPVIAPFSFNDIKRLYHIIRTNKWESDEDLHDLAKRCSLTLPENGGYWFYIIDQEEILTKAHIKHDIETGTMAIHYVRVHQMIAEWYPLLLAGSYPEGMTLSNGLDVSQRLQNTFWYIFKQEQRELNTVTVLENCKYASFEAVSVYKEGRYYFDTMYFYNSGKERYEKCYDLFTRS
jgi:hypothetical protein